MNLVRRAEQPDAMAKLAGMQLCRCIRRETGRQFFTVIPNNLYGVRDHYDPVTAHVIPAMLRRYHSGKLTGTVSNWGTGHARREFIFVRDAARAMVLLMNTYLGADPVNIGVGHDVSMFELAEKIAFVTEFRGTVQWDSTKPEGAARRLLDNSVLAKLGWRPEVSLESGLKLAYQDFLCQLH